VTAYLKKYVDCKVNHKGIALLMRNNGLVVPRNTRLRARREPKTRKPVTDIPNTFWGEDMTKTWTLQGWAYVHVVLDWGSKKLLALLASATSRASDWIRALDNAVNLQYPDGLDPDEQYQFIPRIVSDNGCQPTSRTFGEYERKLGLEHVFTSYDNPKGDADTERVIRTLKEDLLWLNEYKTIEELQEALNKWQHDYNNVFPHSSIANCTPVEYEERWGNGTEPQNTRAKKILAKTFPFLVAN